MRHFFVIITLAIFSVVHVIALGKITEEAKKVPQVEGSAATLPLSILKITALDYDGLASDFLFLKSLVFLGSTFERKERPRVKDWEWKWLYHTLEASAALDPYFFDPYVVANANLTWEGRLYQETNRLLEQGIRYRDWDPTLPFFVGFNYFYFLQENEKASEYLMVASKRPGASPIYANLAIKLAYKSRRMENAIVFLEELLKKTDDETLKKEYETRLEALRDILLLENAVNTYKKKFSRAPRQLDDLVKKGVIQGIPQDSYSGEFYLDLQGVVKTTSEYRLLPYRR